MKLIFVIAGGDALGAVGRYAVMMESGQWTGFASPVRAMTIIKVGFFLLRALLEIIALPWTPSGKMRVFLVVGAIVGFTAFSSFALDTGLLLQRHELGLVILYVGDSMILSPPGFLACLSPLRQAPT